MKPEQLYYGGIPVPYTVSWTAEEGSEHLAICRWAGGRLALCMREARGEGKPRFGAPNMIRQRQTISLALCDLCGRPLKNRTKVSLSKARPFAHGASYGDILQFEPMLHAECAATSMQHCPSLKADIAAGTLLVRQVSRWNVQLAVLSAEGNGEKFGDRRVAIGHAKVQLIDWVDRDEAWLRKAGAR